MAAGEAEIAPAQRAAATQSARQHLALAQELSEPRRGGLLVLMCGVVGTGKSSVAGELADAQGAAVVASDRVRKQLAGLAPTDRGGAQGGIYTAEWTERVYQGLLERAEPVLGSGRTAILDATFPRAEFRARAVAWARARGAACWIVETRCPPPLARARLAQREREGRDPSDAGPALHASSEAGFEPVAAGEADRHLVIATDRDTWRSDLRAALLPGAPTPS
jgi:predicted kinase